MMDEEDAEARAMAELMGFSTFDSTAGKGVDDPRCKLEAVNKKEKRKYRQYMNRRGGFNRPLDPV
jgi:U4/U6.U5 tri-snRNP-associated protein 3